MFELQGFGCRGRNFDEMRGYKYMIYELYGKIPKNSSFIYSEDVLTSTIFGNLRYLNNNWLLNNFISQATDLNGGHYVGNLSEKTVINFWRKYSSKSKSNNNEPDLVFEDEDNVLIIECKYHSPLEEQNLEDERSYENQLIRYSTIINEYYSEKKSKNIIFLTTKHYCDIYRIFEETRKKLSSNIGLYWLIWENLYTSIREYQLQETSKGEDIILYDLKEFLKKRDLISFTGIRIQKTDFSWKYKINYCFNSKYDSFNWRYEK